MRRQNIRLLKIYFQGLNKWLGAKSLSSTDFLWTAKWWASFCSILWRSISAQRPLVVIVESLSSLTQVLHLRGCRTHSMTRKPVQLSSFQISSTRQRKLPDPETQFSMVSNWNCGKHEFWRVFRKKRFGRKLFPGFSRHFSFLFLWLQEQFLWFSIDLNFRF